MNTFYYRDCIECGDQYPIEAYQNKDKIAIYYRCPECRRKYVREHQAARRCKIKEQSLSLEKMNADALKKQRLQDKIRIVRYLIDEAGRICNHCGYSRNIKALKLMHPDSLLDAALESYLDEVTKSSWQAVVVMYRDSMPLCANCAIEYQDKCFVCDDLHLMKNNMNPKQPN